MSQILSVQRLFVQLQTDKQTESDVYEPTMLMYRCAQIDNYVGVGIRALNTAVTRKLLF